MASIFDQASLIFDGRLAAGASGKLFPLKPNVKDLTGDFLTVARAGTKWVLGANGLLTQVQANTPAFEFNADGTYRGCLVEPSAVNLLLYNNDFSNAYWTKTLVTPTSQANAKFGTVWTLTDSVDASPQLHFLRRNEGLTAGSTSTGNKIYAKAGTMTRIRITATGAAIADTGVSSADINLSTGAILAKTANTTVNVTPFGDGWYEIECGATNVETNSRWGVVMLNNSGNATYQGDGTGTVFICRAMKVDNTLICGSDIPTVASTVTRVADSITLTGAGSLIGQSAGTLLVEASVANLSTVSFGRILEVGTNVNNRISIMANAGAVRGFITTAGVDTQGGVMNEFVANNTVFRAALAYQVGAGLGALYVNGTGDITSPTAVPASSISSIGSSITAAFGCVSHIRSVALFPTRLTNAQLQALTTP